MTQPDPPFPSDLVTEFFNMTKEAWSPECFRRWAGIAMVGAAAERRVFVKTGDVTTFLNLYTFFVAPPGTGKKIIDKVKELMDGALQPGTSEAAFHIGADSLTIASLVDALQGATASRVTRQGTTYTYHSLFLSSEEFAVFMPSYDPGVVGKLNDFYENKPSYREERRGFKKEPIEIKYPQLNWLAGIQPALMAATFPDEFWSTGIGRRAIMIYNADRKFRDPFIRLPNLEAMETDVKRKLGEISQYMGQINWEPEAEEFFKDWCKNGCQPEPTHSRLVAYNQNRIMNGIKLAGISSISRGNSFKITLQDIHRALEWMFEIEKIMPDIFRAMIGKNDWQIVEELQDFALSHAKRFKEEPMQERLLIQFLAQRLPNEKIRGVLEMALRSGVVENLPGTTIWRPGAKMARRAE